MSDRTSSMAEQSARAGEIDEVVRQATSHWAKCGIPLSSRRRKADELRDHLEAAVADGRDVRDVVGPDVVAFAAAWAQADRERNWVEPVLFLAANLTLSLGLFALLGPVIEADRESLGMPAGVAFNIELCMVYLCGIWLVRWFRAQITKTTARVLYGLIVVTFVVSILAVARIGRLDGDIELSPVVVAALIVVGLSSAALSSWMKRTNRL